MIPREHLIDDPPELRFEAVFAPGLHGIDAQARPGRKIAVIGGNGAGKSTLLALAAGLEHPSSGRVTLAGRDVTALPTKARRRMIGYLSARSPILAGSLRRALTMGAPERPTDVVIEACAEAFGLGQVLERLGGLDGVIAEAARNLSSGEVRRLLLARIALSRPRLILLDEPDDTLDQPGRALVEELLRSTDATAITATHNLTLARNLDKTWHVERGNLIDVRSPNQHGNASNYEHLLRIN